MKRKEMWKERWEWTHREGYGGQGSGTGDVEMTGEGRYVERELGGVDGKCGGGPHSYRCRI